jgi:cell division protein FtsB
MVTYRHKILLEKIRNKIRPEDIQSAKLVLLFVAMFGVISFFAFRIIETVNKGMESQSRVENIALQVEKLDKENRILKSERDSSISESEIEAQYRALGYKKPGEEIYIINREPTPTLTQTIDESVNNTAKKGPENWEKWVILIFN